MKWIYCVCWPMKMWRNLMRLPFAGMLRTSPQESRINVWCDRCWHNVVDRKQKIPMWGALEKWTDPMQNCIRFHFREKKCSGSWRMQCCDGRPERARTSSTMEFTVPIFIYLISMQEDESNVIRNEKWKKKKSNAHKQQTPHTTH